MKRLVLIDGNSLFHRAYHALPTTLTNRFGQPINAVYGFSNMLLKTVGEAKPDYMACAFDTAAPTFRHVAFEAYKAQRISPPPDLYPQLPTVKNVLDAFGIKFFEREGFEADDLLATLTTKNLKMVDQVIIFSGDRDLLQMVNGKVKVQMPGWNLKETSLYGSAEVKQKFGLEPHQMIDYKSLVGDPSDNIPGVSGVGPKTASSLLQKYHTLENLFKNVDELSEQLQIKLKAGENIALEAKKLVELDCNVDLSFKIEDLRFKPNWEEVRNIFEQLEFRSIIAKLPLPVAAEKTKLDNQMEFFE